MWHKNRVFGVAHLIKRSRNVVISGISSAVPSYSQKLDPPPHTKTAEKQEEK
jgi:hypothetical protein